VKIQPKPKLSPMLALLIGVMAASSAAILIRFAQREAPSLVVATYRLGIATLVLAPIALMRSRQEIARINRKLAGMIIFTGVVLGLHFATWISSLEYASVASSVVLVTSSPLWVALLSPLIIKERLSKTIFVGLILALIGGVVVGLSDNCSLTAAGIRCEDFSSFFGGRAIWGNILALAGAWLVAIYLLMGRLIRPSISLIPYTFLIYGVAAITLLILTIISGSPLTGYSPTAYLWFAALAFIPQLLGHTSFNYALKFITASFVSIAILCEPVGTTIMAAFLLNEPPTWLEVAGGVLLLIGIYIAIRAEKSTQVPEIDPEP
jgi:drug/metabolite transporter (DMT)-like permease